jgi:peptidoglycan/LPS O-acetylase OafA/YrhL
MTTDVEIIKPIKAYRSDIDGLRAIAVISVMLYHFSVWPFTGGFVGVDVFFVISGYLITGGILKEESHHDFSYGDFYIRRARRLFPALLFTIAVSYILSFIVFSPIDFEKMSASTVFALSGISNYYYWMSAGYFDSESILKPLLHTWSLSVELQFYLLWPLILLTLAKFGRKAVAIGAITLTFTGFLFSLYAISHDSTGAYYLTQYRFWEFAAGGLVFLFRRSPAFNHLARAHAPFFITGLALILYPVFFYSAKTTFPGVNALMPVLGSMLIILTGDKTYLGKLLSLKPMRYTGEISYSLYLVHWPVIVFLQYIFIKNFSGMTGLMLVVISFTITIPIYRLIEKPLRNPNTFKISGSAFCLACSCFAIITITTSASSWAGRGWVWRLPEQIQKINDFDLNSLQKYVGSTENTLKNRKTFSNNGRPKLLIVGDSQSADISNIMKESGLLNDFDAVTRSINTRCRAIYVNPSERENYWKNENGGTIALPQFIPMCENQMNSLDDDKLLKEASIIFIAMKWRDESIPKMQEAIDMLKTSTNAKIYLFGNKNIIKSSIDLANAFGRVNGLNNYASRFRDLNSDRINSIIMNTPQVKFVDMMKLTCPEKDDCNVLTPDLKPIFFDQVHLTREGAIFFGDGFKKAIKEAGVITH